MKTRDGRVSRRLMEIDEADRVEEARTDSEVVLDDDLDPITRKSLHSMIREEYDAAQNKLLKLRDAKLRLLACSERVTPYLISVLFEVGS